MLTTMGEALKKAGLITEEDEKRAIERYKKDEAEALDLLKQADVLTKERNRKALDVQVEKENLAKATEKLERFKKQKLREKLIISASESVRESMIRVGKLERELKKLDVRMDILMKKMLEVRNRL